MTTTAPDNLASSLQAMNISTTTIREDEEEKNDPASSSLTTSNPEDMVVVVVDPYSTGCLIVKEIMKRGYSVIALWTTDFSDEMKTHIPKSAGTITYHTQIDQKGQ